MLPPASLSGWCCGVHSVTKVRHPSYKGGPQECILSASHPSRWLTVSELPFLEILLDKARLESRLSGEKLMCLWGLVHGWVCKKIRQAITNWVGGLAICPMQLWWQNLVRSSWGINSIRCRGPVNAITSYLWTWWPERTCGSGIAFSGLGMVHRSWLCVTLHQCMLTPVHIVGHLWCHQVSC